MVQRGLDAYGRHRTSYNAGSDDPFDWEFLDRYARTHPPVAAYSLGRRFNRLIFGAVHSWLLDNITYFARHCGSNTFAAWAGYLTNDHWLHDAIYQLVHRKMGEFYTAFADGNHFDDLSDTNVELASLFHNGLEDEFARLRDDACSRIAALPLAIARELEVVLQVGMDRRQKILFELAKIIDAAACPPDLWRDVVNLYSTHRVSDPHHGCILSWEELAVLIRRPIRNFLLPDYVRVAVRPPGAIWLRDLQRQWAIAEMPKDFLDRCLGQLSGLGPTFQVNGLVQDLHLAAGIHLLDTCLEDSLDADDEDADCDLG